MEHGERYLGNDRNRTSLTTPAARLVILSVSNSKSQRVSTTEDGHEPSRPPGGSFGEAGCLGNRAVVAVPAVLGQQQKPQDQSVPDAPTPQQPDSLGNLTSGMTPGKGTQDTPPDQGTNTTRCRPPRAASHPVRTRCSKRHPEVPAPGQMQKDLATFRTTVNYVIVPVTVLDKKHQQVAGLTWRDFQIYENNERQRIAFFSADAVPLSVALVIDQSLPRDTMKKVNDSLAAIQGGFTPSDEIAVFTYADGVNNPTDFTAALSARVPAVLEQSKKPGDYLGAPINGGPLYGGPTINGRSVDPNLDPQRGNSGVRCHSQGNPYPERCHPGRRQSSFHPAPGKPPHHLRDQRRQGIAQQSQLPRGGALS